MRVATINIMSVKLLNREPLRPTTYGGVGQRDADYTITTTGDTIVTYPVSIRVFEAPAPDTLNYEAFRVVVAQPMDETPGRMISPLTEASGSVMGAVIAHLMYISTVYMPQPPPLS